MKEQFSGVISFLGYRLARFEYNCSPGFNFTDLKDGKLQFNFSKARSTLDNGETQINLLTVVFFSNNDSVENAPFRIIVELAGKFREADNGPWDPKWDSNAIAIMYPYVRAMIGTVTSQSGRETILLPTVNVAAMFSEKEDHKEAQE